MEEDPNERPPRNRIDKFLFPEDADKLPRTGIDKFLWGSGKSPGLGAIWWGGGALIAGVGVIVALLYGSWWWELFLVPVAAWQFWEMKKAIDRLNF